MGVGVRPRTHGNVFLESRTTSSLLETIQKRPKTFPCVRGLSEPHEHSVIKGHGDFFIKLYLNNEITVPVSVTFILPKGTAVFLSNKNT